MINADEQSPKKPFKLIAVDDNQVNLTVMVKQLGRDTGYHITTFENGSEFLAAMEAPHADLPDLILLDIIMPEPDGFEVARQLKKMESTEDIPIIFLTSLDDTKSRVKAFENGGIDYVSKPFRKDELIAHINAHLQLKQVNEELALVDIRIRNLNNELEKAKTEQERLNDQKNQFLAVITRDESLTFI